MARLHMLKTPAMSPGGQTGADDARLVLLAIDGDGHAKTRLYHRHAPRTERVLVRILGVDSELSDVLQDVFLAAFRDLEKLREPSKFRSWLAGIAVRQARNTLRKRARKRWLRLGFQNEALEVVVPGVSHDQLQAMRRTYAVLDKLPADERIALTLRQIEGMELTEVAEACGVSLATAKRRIKAGRERIQRLASRDPMLREWLQDPTEAGAVRGAS